MNTTTTTDRRHTTLTAQEFDEQLERQSADPPPRQARRLRAVDRAALHLGIALVRWGRRPGRELARHERRVTPRERAMLAHESRQALARREAELAMQDALLRRVR